MPSVFYTRKDAPLPENQPGDSYILIDKLFKIMNKLPNTVCRRSWGSYYNK